MVEVLAPVGSIEMLNAALCAQADAVYLSGKSFGARAYAQNFDLDQLKAIFDELHLKHKRVYVTVNTLLSDDELMRAVEYAQVLYEAGADALIIQDLGLLKLLKEVLPQMSLHASTQLTLYDVEGVLWAKEMGFDRVVLARETSLDMIRRIRESTDIELEVFVHGSLCISYSGNCFMSSHIGGRSGNRGRCAQPCRKKYRLIDANGKALGAADALISPKDMMTISRVLELIEAGIHSFKIEGRMKRPSYVYQAVTAYQNAIKNEPVAKDKLEEVSKRAFTQGYLFNCFGKSMLQLEQTQRGTLLGVVEKSKTPFFRTLKALFKGDSLSIQTGRDRRIPMTLTCDYAEGESVSLVQFPDALITSKVFRLYSERNETMKEEIKLPISMFFSAQLNKPLKLTLIYGHEEVTVVSNVMAEKVQSHPVSEANIYKQLGRLGETIYKLDHLEIDMSEPVFFSLSAIGSLRREAILLLNSKRLKPYHRILAHPGNYSWSPSYHPMKKRRVSLSLEKWEGQVDRQILGQVDRIYLEDFSNVSELQKTFLGDLYLKMPVVDTDQGRSRIKKIIETMYSILDGVEVENPGQAYWLRGFWKGPIHAGYHWNIFNGQALELLKKEDVASGTLSTELSMTQIESMGFPIETEFIGYGRLLSMTMRHCPASEIKGCRDDRSCNQCLFKRGFALQDELGELFPFERRDGISYIWHHEIMDGASFLKRLADSNVHILRFEEGPDLETALKSYISAWKEGTDAQPVTSGLFSGHLSKGIE